MKHTRPMPGSDAGLVRRESRSEEGRGFWEIALFVALLVVIVIATMNAQSLPL